ncbi:MAG: hypothetical protein II625_00440 [Bacilli bacterium]|nr:hypothetical protein [Bacilli bacterium]
MLKEKLIIAKKINKISLIIIFFLLVSNIILMNTYNMNNSLEEVEEVVYFKPTEDKYNEKTKYYADISFKKFKKLYKSNAVSTIVVIDSKSNVSETFIKMINKMAYYKSTKMYVIRLNKLTTKQEVEFYNLDEKLSKLESNYIITVSNSKIVSITTFDEEKINVIEKELGE